MNGLEFAFGIVFLSTVGWLVSSWIRAKHGYPIENEWMGMTHRTDPEATSQVKQLTTENGQLRAQITRLEERIGVLERIATDPAERTAREIEALRGPAN